MKDINKILNVHGEDEETFLANYDITAFDRPSLTVDTLLLTVDNIVSNNIRKLSDKTLKILLIKRNEHPFIDQWAIPGGFVRMDEDLEAAAYRELLEETGVNNAYLEQLYTFADVNRDPRGRIVSTAYMSLVDINNITTKAGTDAADAKWFDIRYEVMSNSSKNENNHFVEIEQVKIILTHEEITLEAIVEINKHITGKHVKKERKLISCNQLAFDHGVIIQLGLERLRNKVQNSDIAFQLMPDLFTLSDLQKTYEVILGKKLLKANFRRKIAEYVEETPDYSEVKGHRPSKLFRYKPYE